VTFNPLDERALPMEHQQRTVLSLTPDPIAKKMTERVENSIAEILGKAR